MAEQSYTVASDSETSHDDKQSSFLELALGIDIGTSLCSVAMWNGSHIELLRNIRNQKLMYSYVLFRDEIPTGGVSEDPEEVLAIFLVELKAVAEVQLKQPVRNVVLTIPITFSQFYQTKIERACAMAGLRILRLMPEPIAVALQNNVGSVQIINPQLLPVHANLNTS